MSPDAPRQPHRRPDRKENWSATGTEFKGDASEELLSKVRAAAD